MAAYSSTLAWKNLMDGGAWWAAVHGVMKSWTWLSDFTFTFHFHGLDKEVATHSSGLELQCSCLENPRDGEPGGLPSVGSHRVGFDWSNLAAAAVVTDSCESWTIKKPERCWTNAFGLWCWRRLLRVPWAARRLNQSILKEVNSEYSLEGLMLKLKHQYFGHLMQRASLL